MKKSVLARFHTEALLYDDQVDRIEIDTENKRYWLFLNCHQDSIEAPDQNGECTRSMAVERFIFDTIRNSVRELFTEAVPNSDTK